MNLVPDPHEAAASDMKDENRVLATHFHEKEHLRGDIKICP
jgi:hypothetical protein